ncbi:MAG TPA: hypothetical protein PK122_00840 [Candidatus Paceibacterota bacterium]|nr:hypothetical protein [Candidatus Paceibacterota bacterium]
MSNSNNSFIQTVADLTRNVNLALSAMTGMNETLTSQEDTVTVRFEGTDPVTGDPSIYTYSMPSYQYTLEQLSRISNTVNTFVSGNGVVLLNDGTYRSVTTVPLSKSPRPIVDVAAPTKFNWRNNWFFENMLFPQMYVEFDLKNKIDDRSDRVVVRRVIFDNFDDAETQWFKDNFVGNYYSYQDTVNILNESGKRYWIDEEVQDLPLNPNKYTGSFIILDKKVLNGSQWYYLDTLNYGLTTDASVVKNIELKIGDQIRYNESLYKIDSIEVTEKRVKLTSLIGIGNPNLNNKFYIYSTPFTEKYVRIPIGYNECNTIFIKGVNDDFNVIADSWGDSISFYTNDLTLTNSTTDLETYYFNYVVDFGKQMEGQAKDRMISAFYGVTPDAPVISVDQFAVKQINTQLNASLDTEDIKNTQTQIESTKTIISSLKTTISQQKAELVELTDPAEREDLQTKIDNNISQLSKKTVEYQSLVKSLATLAYENNAVFGNPKYRVRGFFEIPAGKKSTANSAEDPQQVIQFEISYRYLRLDNTGNPLNTYSYNDPSTGQKITGTFTDWQIMQSPIKSKKYDSTLGKYVWSDENVGDGEQVNINQVDIPITKGEKVEMRIRSISEAGWPQNPLKSSWSNSVIVEFPANLEGSDQVANILSDATQESAQIQLDETLNATGVITHLQDGYPNPNAGSGTYFKHQSRFLSYDWGKKDVDGDLVEEKSLDLQTILDELASRIFVRINKPGGAGSKVVTIQEALQKLVDASIGIYNDLENNN